MFKTLKAKHGDSYDVPRLRLWSRMICSNIHDDTDSPPNIPAFTTSSVTKKARKDSFANAMEGTAVAFANAVSKPNNSPRRDSSTPLPSAISPGKMVELRMKHFEQLRYL